MRLAVSSDLKLVFLPMCKQTGAQKIVNECHCVNVTVRGESLRAGVVSGTSSLYWEQGAVSLYLCGWVQAYVWKLLCLQFAVPCNSRSANCHEEGISWKPLS